MPPSHCSPSANVASSTRARRPMDPPLLFHGTTTNSSHPHREPLPPASPSPSRPELLPIAIPYCSSIRAAAHFLYQHRSCANLLLATPEPRIFSPWPMTGVACRLQPSASSSTMAPPSTSYSDERQQLDTPSLLQVDVCCLDGTLAGPLFPAMHQLVAATTKKTPNSRIPNYPSLPSQLLCQVHNITMHADKDANEVYA
ncbi:uncharacterized protein [Triticum aestivum]|uniref:uncharacterized protein n=1 Tax=Triticum aestivum TaxID=4565 RepID=UPI001D01C7F4|nr:uncharacterized protein LOC123115042 [Triticum aestivum]XP_044392278.1 uncharacterized protein LOC123115042 [Triticum aestivum]